MSATQFPTNFCAYVGIVHKSRDGTRRVCSPDSVQIIMQHTGIYPLGGKSGSAEGTIEQQLTQVHNLLLGLINGFFQQYIPDIPSAAIPLATPSDGIVNNECIARCGRFLLMHIAIQDMCVDINAEDALCIFSCRKVRVVRIGV